MNAANVATANLALYAIEAVAATDKIGNRALLVLRFDVIELQNDRITFTAIHARM
jgi:hypothetical protein